MLNSKSLPLTILTTARLTLRQLSFDDRQGILALRSDRQINKYLDREPSKTIEDAIIFINKINENIAKNKAFYWAITLTQTKAFVGTICLFDFSSEKDSCEIGYELLTAFQGQGIMSEAAAAVIDHAFQTLRVKRMLACSHCENESSSKLLTKLNFIKSVERDKEKPSLEIFSLEKPASQSK